MKVRPRTKVAISAVATVIAIAVTAYLASDSFIIALTAATAAAAATSFAVVALDRHKIVTLNANFRKHIKPIHDRLTRIDRATYRTNDIAGSVHSLRREVEEISEILETLAEPSSTLAEPPQPQRNPPKKSAVFHATHPGVTTLRSGPLAAVGGETNNEARFLEAVASVDQMLRPAEIITVAYIGDTTPCDTPGIHWLPLNPAFAIEQLHNTTPHFVFVDLSALDGGLWANAHDAVGARLYLTLWEVLIYARDHGTPTIAHEVGSISTTFSEEIRSIADVLVSDGQYSIGHEAHNNLHFVNELISAVATKRAAN